MMISATDGLDEWTVSQLGKFAIRLDRIASEEALWNSTIQADTSTSRGAPPTTRGGKTRVCHNCGRPGHIARDCRSKPRAGNAAINMRPANAPTNQRPGPRGPCYHCHQMGHVAAECPDRQPGGKLARREPGKPWCEHHRVNSHSTAECRAFNNDKPKAEARATHTVDEEPASSHDAPDRPTYNELLEFWESQQAMMAQGYSGTLRARSMANASPCSVTRPNARAASTFHPGLTKRGPKNQRIKGRLSNMPLGFLPRDTIGPPRPMRAPAPAPHVPSAGSEPESIADPPAMLLALATHLPGPPDLNGRNPLSPFGPSRPCRSALKNCPRMTSAIRGKCMAQVSGALAPFPLRGLITPIKTRMRQPQKTWAPPAPTPSRLQRPRLLLRRVSLAPLSLRALIGIMATTEALVRCGVKVRKVYACEIESKTREVAQRRLITLSTIRPEQLSREAIHGAHSHLFQDIRVIMRRHIKQMETPDLVVDGFHCQGFLMASDTPKGLRDPRTALFQEALRVIHLI
jgi:hypothetical protein